MEAKWCAPGDDQQDRWLVRFNDHDMRDALFTGPDAETEARTKWDMMCGPSGTWNGYLFRLAARPTADLGEDGELVERIKQVKAERKRYFNLEGDVVDVLLTDCWDFIEKARALLSRSGDD